MAGRLAFRRWLHAKLLSVTALSGVHGWAVGAARSFASGERRHDARFYAGIAGAAGLLAVAIVMIAVVKPM